MERTILETAVAERLSTRDIAKKFGTSPTNIRYHLTKYGLATRPKYKPRAKKARPKCLECGAEAYAKFCSNRCQRDYDLKQWVDAWVKNEVTAPAGSPRIKRALVSLVGNKCERCGWCEVHPVTGNVPVQLHHEDGDDSNNKRDNVGLLCPNCHSLTPNYAALNVRKTPKPYIRNPKY
jgi:endogenous inhibitor of DNA gyrase (YacG/DUF329 family)